MNDEEVIAEFLWAGYTRYDTVQMLEDMDEAMGSIDDQEIRSIIS